jgi:hypothetical protein
MRIRYAGMRVQIHSLISPSVEEIRGRVIKALRAEFLECEYDNDIDVDIDEIVQIPESKPKGNFN